MNNLAKFYNNEGSDDGENLYLYFTIGEIKYAVNSSLVVEIIKLPQLEYPQRLPNNVVGLLNYNNFMINILDIRFYLGVKVTPYSASSHVLVVKTDEAIFGLLIDKVEDIVFFEPSKTEHFSLSGEDMLINYLYHHPEKGVISVVNLYSLENLLKKGVKSLEVDIPSLFPRDEDSRYKLMQRSHALEEKSREDLSKNIFTHEKFISFSLNDNNYCIDLGYVRELLKNQVITPVPCTPDYIKGLISLRGDFVVVVDLKTFLNFAVSQGQEKNRIIVVETSDFKVGFLVDEIFSIVEIPEELIEKHPQGKINQYVLCETVFNDNLYTILDTKNILSDEKLYIDEKV